MVKDIFIGGQSELTRLASLLKKKSTSLVVVKGRRRIGKSRRIEEFAKEKNFLRLAGIPTTKDINGQLQ